MTQPKLSLAGSGLGGRGYRDIFGSGAVLPSITTALGALDKPGLVNWHVEQTAAFAVTHVEDLLRKSEEAGMRYLQYFSRRKPDSFDDPEIDVYNAADFVLSDLSNTGDWIHKFVEDDLNGGFTETPQREDHEEMANAYLQWKSENDVEVLSTERTVYGDGYAGTGDWWGKVNGVMTLVDNKSSRKIHETHIAQLAALGAAHTSAVEVAEGTEGAVYHKLQPKVSAEHGGQVDSWWRPEAVPDFGAYAVLQIRPSDWTTKGEYIEPFCKLHYIPQAQIDAGFELFSAGLAARIAQRNLKNAQKEEERF